MRTLRPVSLNKIIKILSTLNSSINMRSEELADILGISYSHCKELIRFMSSLKLIVVSNNMLSLARDGLLFLKGFNEGSYGFLNSILMRNDAYRLVYECYNNGLRKAVDIAKCAGVGLVTADIALRLIREVESLKHLKSTNSTNSANKISEFENTLIESYIELSNARKNRYVPLFDIMRKVIEKMGINEHQFLTLLRELVRRRKGWVLLVSAPSLTHYGYLEVDGKPYTHIMFVW